MPDMIEPNIHPVLVHFAYALMTVSALSLFVVSLAPASAWRDTLKHAGDWMLAVGAIAVVATVAAGFQAYYSVAHDAPSHAAMTTHRNWALPTAALLLVLAAWRFVRRQDKPGLIFSMAFLAVAGLLSVTAWWGGKLVYGHGLGVASMPQATSDGHDHEHAAGEEQRGDDQRERDVAALDEGGASGVGATPSGEYPSTPAGVVDAFGAALRSGDAAIIERILLPDVLVAEGGGAERSFAEYAGHHMPADMEFSKAVETTIKDRRIFEDADMTTVVTTAQTHGAFRGKTVHHQTMETIVLRRDGGGWRIAHIHWSSAPITDEHEH